MVDLRVYQDAGVEKVVAAMFRAGAQGKLMQGEQRFWIHWPGGCHVTSVGSKNDPPLVVRDNATSGKCGAYCYTCEHEALATVHALLDWQPSARPPRGRQSTAVAPRWTPGGGGFDTNYPCQNCGRVAYRRGGLCPACIRDPSGAVRPAPAVAPPVAAAPPPQIQEPDARFDGRGQVVGGGAIQVDESPPAADAPARPAPPPAAPPPRTYADWLSRLYPADDYAGIGRILDRGPRRPFEG